ncbi:MAG: hypothetical protein ABIF10_06160 [Candidatus Woesearchaeota archaeon]
MKKLLHFIDDSSLRELSKIVNDLDNKHEKVFLKLGTVSYSGTETSNLLKQIKDVLRECVKHLPL